MLSNKLALPQLTSPGCVRVVLVANASIYIPRWGKNGLVFVASIHKQ